jgi:CheY-like chemotaxis protein
LDENRLELMEIGADDFISKPFREGELFEKIHAHVGVEYVYADHPTPAAEEMAAELTPASLGAGRKTSSRRCVKPSSQRIWTSCWQRSRRLKPAIPAWLRDCAAWPKASNTRNSLIY